MFWGRRKGRQASDSSDSNLQWWSSPQPPARVPQSDGQGFALVIVMLFVCAERPVALAITLSEMACSPCCPPVAGVRLCPRAAAAAAGLRGQGGGGLHPGAEVGSCRLLPPPLLPP